MTANNQQEALNEEYVLPSDVPAEKNVVGAILSEAGLYHEVSRILTAEAFYVTKHSLIWGAMVELSAKTNDCSLFSVITHFQRNNKLNEVGGAVYLTHIANNSRKWAQIYNQALWLKEIYLRRKLIQLQQISVNNLFANTGDIFDELAEIQNNIEKLVNEIQGIKEDRFQDVVDERVGELKDAAKNHTYKTGICGYLDALDRQTNGFQPSDLIIIAGRPSMGKTALAVDLARKQAKNGISVGIFSLEMSTRQLIDRLLASETDIDLKTIRKGGMNFHEWQKVDERVIAMKNYPLVICEKGGLPINEICSKAKLWKMKYGIQILYVDYIGLISDGGLNRGRSREQEVSHISSRLKALAKDLHIPVVALSQLSRAVETRGGTKVPQLSDLRDSGSLEQDSDLVIFPHRPAYYEESHPEPDLCELYIAKYRNGQTGKVKIKFNGAHQKFEDYEFT